MSWQPGDPIYDRRHSGPLTIRPMIQVLPDTGGTDARWPVPYAYNDLDDPIHGATE